MQQLVREPGSGKLRIESVPAPILRPGGLLVRTHYSVISVGTERQQLEFGRKTLLGKARSRPDQVRQVIEVARREGIQSAYRKARHRLNALMPLGYSTAGTIEAIGEGVTGFEVGQRVACAGAGYANHAELNWVPKNLVVPIPDEAPLEGAAFATVGAIAMQGVRQAGLSLGESAVVIGLGLLGQLTVQLLVAAGVTPIGLDLDDSRVELAERYGALGIRGETDPEEFVRIATSGIGADAVIITAASSSSQPLRLGAALARERARLVVVGAVPIELDRSPAYEKELELRLSRSYGPGRYDPNYEERGHDYPVGYVRWTEGRNLAEFVRLTARRAIDPIGLITHRYEFTDAVEAYETLTGPEGRSALGVVLHYPEKATQEPDRIELKTTARVRSPRRGTEPIRLGLIGAGGFASGVLLPELARLGLEFRGVVTASGLTARDAAERHGFDYIAGAPEALFQDPEINLIVIATRHDQHAHLTAEALRAGKAVFVEKPLALDQRELDEVVEAAKGGPPLMVGFNRRFAPATQFIRERLETTSGARLVQIRVNAGHVPPDSWVHDPIQGGGRLIGEGCHFIDLALYLIGAPVRRVRTSAIGGGDPDAALGDNLIVTLETSDGSIASVLYTSKGDTGAGKERIEVFAGGTTGVIDDFRRAEFWGRRRERWRGVQDKGHTAELEAFIAALRGTAPIPIPLDELEASSRATIWAAEALSL